MKEISLVIIQFLVGLVIGSAALQGMACAIYGFGRFLVFVFDWRKDLPQTDTGWWYFYLGLISLAVLLLAVLFIFGCFLCGEWVLGRWIVA